MESHKSGQLTVSFLWGVRAVSVTLLSGSKPRREGTHNSDSCTSPPMHQALTSRLVAEICTAPQAGVCGWDPARGSYVLAGPRLEKSWSTTQKQSMSGKSGTDCKDLNCISVIFPHLRSGLDYFYMFFKIVCQALSPGFITE